MSKEEKAKLTHIKALVATAMADGKLEEAEKAMLALVVKREGISEKDFMAALNGKNIDFTIPEDEQTKTRYLRDLVAMMVVDGSINPEELKICILAARSFGFTDEKAKEIINEAVAAALESGYDADKLTSEL